MNIMAVLGELEKICERSNVKLIERSNSLRNCVFCGLCIL
jgi:hypothetical protein